MLEKEVLQEQLEILKAKIKLFFSNFSVLNAVEKYPFDSGQKISNFWFLSKC